MSEPVARPLALVVVGMAVEVLVEPLFGIVIMVAAVIWLLTRI